MDIKLDFEFPKKFHLLAEKHGLSYAIVGGYANTFWGDQRNTLDIDYVASISQCDLAADVLEKLDYYRAFMHPKRSFAHFFPKEQGRGPRIDFMFVMEDTFCALKNEFVSACPKSDNSVSYPYVGLMHFISMKLHSASQPDRQHKIKDLNDIVGVCLRNNLSLRDLEDKGILKKYGNENSIARLRDIYSDRGGR